MSSTDVIERHRKQVTRWLSLTATLMVLPFAANNLFQGRWLVAMSSIAVLVILGSNAWGRGTVRITWLAPAIGLFLYLCFQRQGIIGALWSYPAIALFYFILPQAQARWVNVALLCVSVPSAFDVLETALALRVLATLLAISITSSIFVHLIALQQEELKRMAVIDPLTQVHNRVNLKMMLDQCRERLRRYRTPVTALALDIDHFKSINDEYGHAAGDAVLRQVAQLLKARLRSADLIFRTGGEEFLVILENTDGDQAGHVAEQLRSMIEQAPMLAGRPVTASVGLAGLAPEENIERWLQRADALLYRAKASGRNTVVASSGGPGSGR